MKVDRHLAAPDIARQELRQFVGMAERAGMDVDRQCRSLHMSRADWQRWLGVLRDEPMPSQPALPVLLRHLGYLTYRLDRMARSSLPA